MSAPAHPGLETQSAAPAETLCTGARSYLLVVDGGSSRRFFLPRDGVVVVGRSPDVDLCVDDDAVSRRHARFIVTGSSVQIVDLGSHNGTRVNGEKIEGSRALASGDVATIGDVTFVLRNEPRHVPGQVVDLERTRERLAQEIDRAIAYGRPLAVIVVALGDATSAGRGAAGVRAAAAIRLMDVIGWAGAAHLVAVVPEVAGEAARAAALEILEAVTPAAPRAKGGLASCPADACDVDTLISAARAAAEIAAVGEVAAAASTAVRHTIGERTIIAADPAMIRLFDLIRRLAASDLPVLVLGETGAGKENAASAVHYWSRRADKPLIAVNCAAIPDTLVESELFGHERGAFSDAKTAKPGLLERANGGTVFLDEVGELPAGAQAKLLRALEARRITRLGDVREREIDVRIVAATNRDLDEECRAGRFRRDLFFRLGAAVVNLPPLRHRPREVLILARMFLEEACVRAGHPAPRLSDAAAHRLAEYDWPGNVRELKNAMEYAVATMDGDVVHPWVLPDRVAGRSAGDPAPTDPRAAPSPAAAAPESDGADPVTAAARRVVPLAEEIRVLERTRIQEALDATGGAQRPAAELIGMPLRTFVLKLKQHGLQARDAKQRS